MVWFKVDDKLHSDDKVSRLEEHEHFGNALALWTLAGSWCGDQLTDGRVPRTQLRKLVPFNGQEAAAALVDVGLWEESTWDEGGRQRSGYQFVNWCKYQPTKAGVTTRREEARERMRKNRAKRSREHGESSREQPPSSRERASELHGSSGSGRVGSGSGSIPEDQAAKPNRGDVMGFGVSDDELGSIKAALVKAHREAGGRGYTTQGYTVRAKLSAALGELEQLAEQTGEAVPDLLATAARGFFAYHATKKHNPTNCPNASWFGDEARMGAYLEAGRSSKAPADDQLRRQQADLNAAASRELDAAKATELRNRAKAIGAKRRSLAGRA